MTVDLESVRSLTFFSTAGDVDAQNSCAVDCETRKEMMMVTNPSPTGRDRTANGATIYVTFGKVRESIYAAADGETLGEAYDAACLPRIESIEQIRWAMMEDLK